MHNAGHNHPYIIQEVKDELDKRGPGMLQSHVPEIAGELAERLCALAGGGLKKAYFGSSGSEGVEGSDQVCPCDDRAGKAFSMPGAVSMV